MVKYWCICLIACVVVFQAQATEPRDAWLMQNYRFTGPPAPGTIPAVDPVIADLQQIQGMLLSIMRKADFAYDWEGALVAGSQAAANAQLIGSIKERLQAAAAAKAGPDEARANFPIYTIALKDRTLASAIAWWPDALMLHYITPQGAHVQVRLDLVDRDLSIRINRAKNLEFNLPQ